MNNKPVSYESIVNGITEGIMTISCNGNIVMLNPSCKQILGIPSSPEGKPFTSLFSADNASFAGLISDAVNGNKRVRNNTVSYFTDGTEKALLLSVSDWFTGDVRTGITVVINDITGTPSLTVPETENNYSRDIRSFLQKQYDGVFITDYNTKNILYADDSLARRYGENPVGKKCYEIIANRSSPCTNCNVTYNEGKLCSWEMISGGRQKSMYYVHAMRNGNNLICRMTDISDYLHLVDDVVDYTSILREQAEKRGATEVLTGLENRNALEKHMKDEYAKVKRFGVVFFDINNLKTVNDTLGHDAGDEIIRHAAVTISKLKTERSHIYRMGGDEFMLVLPDADERDMELLLIKWKLISRDNVTESGIKFDIAAGSALGEENEPLDVTVKKADAEMYKNKAEIKNNRT